MTLLDITYRLLSRWYRRNLGIRQEALDGLAEAAAILRRFEA